MLLIDPPARDEIDGLRRALGASGTLGPSGPLSGTLGPSGPLSGTLGRIPPHVTLVPPINVPASRLGAALAALRQGAGSVRGALALTFGPVATFAPVNPVLYLRVGGDLDQLRALRDAVFVPPFARRLTWSWVPHVTLSDEANAAHIDAGMVALDHYAVAVTVDRVVLLVERRDDDGTRRWEPLADAALGPASLVGRGGLPLEMTVGRLVDPEAAALLARFGRAGMVGGARDVRVVTGRREGEIVGVAGAWIDDDGGHVGVIVDPAVRGQGIGRHLRSAIESATAAAGWACSNLAAAAYEAGRAH